MGSFVYISETRMKGQIFVGIGFLVTIILLATVLGLFSKQALSSTQHSSDADAYPGLNEKDETTVQKQPQQTDDVEVGHRPHAM